MVNQMMRATFVRYGWLVALSALGAGCKEQGLPVVNDDGGLGGSAGSQSSGWQTFPALGAHEVDLLLAVDDAQGIAPVQAKMVAAMPAMMDALAAAPNGPPDLHVGVISSDSGAGRFEVPELHCSFPGDKGLFRSSPVGGCTTPSLLSGQTFFQVVNGVASYHGGLADAVGCVSALGDQGCGFAGSLKSIRLALDPAGAASSAPSGGANAGFLRPEAFLAVVLLSHKDDCSVPDASDLPIPNQTLMSDPLGPLAPFRCNEFGHLCQINGALAHPPRGAASNLQGCVSDESGTLLTKVSDEVSFLNSLKSDPNRIFVATISGPTTPYSISMVQEANAPQPHPQVVPSCALATGEYAEPPVRIQQWVNSFGSRGVTFPICADSLTPAFQSIGQAIADRAGALCVNGPFPARSDSTQPNCRVADLFPGAPVGEAGQIIPNCVDNGGTASCWTAVDDLVRCGTGTKSLVITRTIPAPASSFVGITCDACPNTVPVKLGCSAQ